MSSCCVPKDPLYENLDKEDEDDVKRKISVKDAWKTMKLVMPFFWPAGETGLKIRLIVAVCLIVLNKLILLGVPTMVARVVQVFCYCYFAIAILLFLS